MRYQALKDLPMFQLLHQGEFHDDSICGIDRRHLIVRSNALIIHYTNNNQVIRDDEFVLIDAGCELKCVNFLIASCIVLTFRLVDTHRTSVSTLGFYDYSAVE